MTEIIVDDGTKIHFESFGSKPGKPALLLLPGWLGSISVQWRPFVAELVKDFWVIMVDLRSHGRSTNTQPNLTLDNMLQDIITLIDHLQIPQLHVAGYSLGGYLGMMLALSQPRLVSTLLVHATKFYWTAETVTRMREQLEPDTMAQKAPGYADQLVKEHGARHWRELVRQVADLITLMAEKGLTEGMVRRIQIPTLFCVGDRDELVPVNEAYRLSRILPNAGLFVLPHVRHPFQTVKPIPFVPMMRHFHLTAQKS
ncbi:MAG: alpha/beta hydrolase [Chloroflexi bacterium]|nr:MAG: alpha/beta hydrolase [Chloroflexota bacterium]